MEVENCYVTFRLTCRIILVLEVRNVRVHAAWYRFSSMISYIFLHKLHKIYKAPRIRCIPCYPFEVPNKSGFDSISRLLHTVNSTILLAQNDLPSRNGRQLRSN